MIERQKEKERRKEVEKEREEKGDKFIELERGSDLSYFCQAPGGELDREEKSYFLTFNTKEP